MPGARFFHNMGVASILAGVILIGLGQLVKRSARLRRIRL